MPEKQYRILIAHYRADIVSGAENSITDFVSQLDGRFEVTMHVPGEGRLCSFFDRLGIQTWIQSVSTPRRLFPGLHQLQSRSFARELVRRKYDAVVCNTVAAASRTATAVKLAGLPLAIYMRDYARKDKSILHLLDQADAVFCISNDVKDHMMRMISPEKVFLAYNYIDPGPVLARKKAHQESRKRLLPFSGHPVIGWVGRITAYKQPEVFLRAIPHVITQLPEARFVIVGSAQSKEKAYEAELRALANSLGIEPYLVFFGQRSDVIEITSELAVSCLTSRREPLGRVILEANLMHIPVIVPDAGGPAEIVDDEVTGLHFSSEAADAEKRLAAQMLLLLQDPSLSARLAENAYLKMFATFASRKHVTIQEKYLENLCNRKL